jgi:hypothetical protein
LTLAVGHVRDIGAAGNELVGSVGLSEQVNPDQKNRPGLGAWPMPLNGVSPVVPFFPSSFAEGGSAGSGELI